MFRLKVIMLASFTLINSFALAQSNTRCIPFISINNCNVGSWEVGIQGLYLQSSFNKSLSYYVNGENNLFRDLSGYWDGGYQLQAGYRFTNVQEINVQWSHLNTSRRSFVYEPFGEFGSTAVQFGFRNQWDAVNFESLAKINFSPESVFNVISGLQFVRIKTSLYSFVNDNFEPDALVLLSTNAYKNDYRGVGPRLGLDMNYKLDNNFSLYAKSATALLIGKSRIKSYGINNAFISVNPNTLVTKGSRIMMVPELETRFGISWSHYGKSYGLLLDLGFMWFNYFNPISALRELNQQEFGQLTSHTKGSSDYGASGPYLGLKYFSTI